MAALVVNQPRVRRSIEARDYRVLQTIEQEPEQRRPRVLRAGKTVRPGFRGGGVVMGCATRRWLKLVSLVIAVVLLLAVPAWAAWSDIDGTLLATYGVDQSELEAISQGYPDGSWRPYDWITRRQFVKIAVQAFDVAGILHGLGIRGRRAV